MALGSLCLGSDHPPPPPHPSPALHEELEPGMGATHPGRGALWPASPGVSCGARSVPGRVLISAEPEGRGISRRGQLEGQSWAPRTHPGFVPGAQLMTLLPGSSCVPGPGAFGVELGVPWSTPETSGVPC